VASLQRGSASQLQFQRCFHEPCDSRIAGWIAISTIAPLTSSIPIIGVGEGISSIQSEASAQKLPMHPGSKMAFWSGNDASGDGGHQLTIRDYLRHSNLHVTNKYLQATSKTKRHAHDKLVDAFLPAGFLPKSNLVQ